MCGAVGIPTPTYEWRDVGCVAVWHNVLLFVLKAMLHAVAIILHRHSSTITFQNTCGSEIDQLCCEISRWNMLPLLLMSVKNQCLTEVPNYADKNLCMQMSSVEALYPKDACECLTQLLFANRVFVTAAIVNAEIQSANITKQFRTLLPDVRWLFCDRILRPDNWEFVLQGSK